MSPLVLSLLLVQAPNLGGIFAPPGSAAADAHALAQSLERYHRQEKALFAHPKLPARQIAEHWQKLRPIRRAAERLIARGQLKRLDPAQREELRGALARVVKHSIELVYVAAEDVDPRLFDADEERTVELLRLALIGNRWLALDVPEVFGIPVEPGVS